MIMPEKATQPRYVVVSPVKDEASHVRLTLDSMVNQTVRPVRWVIVDDGSSDETPRILEEYAARHDWIQVVRIDRGAKRDLGVTEIRAFAEGYSRVKDLASDFVVKLDCDLDLPVDYFERLLAEFEKDPRLGIASGIYLEKSDGGEWLPVQMPDYHAAGASKVVRKKCFDEIDGFILYRGWDTVDEIKAQMRGWETRHFADVKFRHLKREGSAMGSTRMNSFHGEIYYLTGGGVLFFLLKVLHRMVSGTPRIVGGAAMLWGYLRCHLTGKKRSVTSEEARFYSRMLNKRLFQRARNAGSESRVREEIPSHN
jgi:glycosyltransferase involved in cell wall biosynthesis